MNGQLARRAQIVCDDDIAKAISVYVTARSGVGIGLVCLRGPKRKQRSRRLTTMNQHRQVRGRGLTEPMNTDEIQLAIAINVRRCQRNQRRRLGCNR